MAPCLKSNAYGHGLEQMGIFFESEGISTACVDSLEELIRLRVAGCNLNILILGYVQKHEIETAIMHGASLLIYEYEIVEQLAKVAHKIGRNLNLHIKIDTGMSRQGLPVEKVHDFIQRIKQLGRLDIEGIATHFAIADEIGNQKYFIYQLKKFEKLKIELERKGIKIPFWHAANSAALLANRQTHFNFVRPGFALYGGYPSNSIQKYCAEKNLILEPALSFKTKIASIKTLPVGSFISYGCSYRTATETKIAILPIGYNDGLNRKRSNRGNVLIKGRKAPIIGNICMNITIVDVTEIPDLRIEDEVVIIGGQSDKNGRWNKISISEIANEIESIPYEVLTQLREGMPRYYI